MELKGWRFSNTFCTQSVRRAILTWGKDLRSIRRSLEQVCGSSMTNNKSTEGKCERKEVVKYGCGLLYWLESKASVNNHTAQNIPQPRGETPFYAVLGGRVTSAHRFKMTAEVRWPTGSWILRWMVRPLSDDEWRSAADRLQKRINADAPMDMSWRRAAMCMIRWS